MSVCVCVCVFLSPLDSFVRSGPPRRLCRVIIFFPSDVMWEPPPLHPPPSSIPSILHLPHSASSKLPLESRGRRGSPHDFCRHMCRVCVCVSERVGVKKLMSCDETCRKTPEEKQHRWLFSTRAAAEVSTLKKNNKLHFVCVGKREDARFQSCTRCVWEIIVGGVVISCCWVQVRAVDLDRWSILALAHFPPSLFKSGRLRRAPADQLFSPLAPSAAGIWTRRTTSRRRSGSQWGNGAGLR